jgi:Zn-dependent peptidase ImmA (M78 family)
MDNKDRKVVIKEICRILNIEIPHIIYSENLHDYGKYFRISNKVLIRDKMHTIDDIFTLAHELKHVQQYKLHKHILFSSTNKDDWDYNTDKFEIEAESFARDMLIHFKSFITKKLGEEKLNV